MISELALNEQGNNKLFIADWKASEIASVKDRNLSNVKTM